MRSSLPPRLRRHLRVRKRFRKDGDEGMPQELWVHSLFARAGDVAQAVQGKVELGAAADDGRTDLLVVSVPHELHPQHVGVGCPLRGGERGRNTMKRARHWSQSDLHRRCLRVRQSCGCSSSAARVFPEGRTGSNCGNRTLSHP